MAAVLTYAVGDIHGSYTKLVNLLRHCSRHCGAHASRFVFIGDYVDRGKRSRDVLNLLIQMQKDAPGQVVCLRGNHEQMLLNAAKNVDLPMWLDNGGGATLRSYGVSRADELPSEHLDWLASLPFAISDGRRFFVHAGIMPGVPLHEQSHEVLLWIREPFLSDRRDHEQYIVHGHTPTEARVVDLLTNRLNLDSGACFGGPLTAAVFDEKRVGPLDFITDDGTVMRSPMLSELDDLHALAAARRSGAR